MPRLDVWLVESGRFSSRQAAKRAIKKGNVTVDGHLCKPSKQITGNESIQVLIDHADVPKGFHKLKRIDDALGGNLVSSSCIALDIGSSAGGFLAYLGLKGAQAIGIEVSTRFTKELRALVDANPHLSILYADAFEIEPSSVADENSLDLLLIDVTTDLTGTLHLVSMYKSLLKKRGRLIAAFKTENRADVVLQIIESVKKLGFDDVKNIHLDDTLQEVHITASRT
ncbi:MAG: S4 domain-containing protein [Candidatus Thorarchaeota archaeon]|nr:S4 domain-containing protein [Candidatus Thorarchaeota archaeon]